MFALPLFPLNTVLFPGMPLYLHIFEDRYKQMIRFCLETNQLFGVVLIRRGQEAFGPLAEPYSTGCIAHIVETHPISGGRMNLTARGQDRFRILSLNTESAPYLIGNVEPYPLANQEPEALQAAVSRFRPLVRRYLDLLRQAGNLQSWRDKLPEHPIDLLYTAAALLQAAPPAKQELLEAGEAGQLLAKLRALYSRETSMLRIMLANGSAGEERTFSRN